MKNVKIYLSSVAIVAMLFSSCSKEDETVRRSEDTATLSFATVLNDLVNKNPALKQSMDEMPECSDAAPDYVEVVLTGTTDVGSLDEPLVVDVSPNAGDYDGDGEEEYFTDESSELELEPGSYTLEYFKVYDSEGNLIWVAPREDGELADFVDNSLPISFDLGAGVKKYVDVEVLCFDNRMVNEYGYLFFDLETTEGIEFCIFGNYCDENGRHFPAEYSVNVWSYEDGQRGEQLYVDRSNNVAMNDNGEYAGDPLCFALPDSEGLDEYYFEITIEDSESYGDIENRVIRAGVINDDLVRTFFDGEDNLDYYHFRAGECGSEDETPIFPDPDDEAEHYKACLYQINGSDAIGFAMFSLMGNTLETTILAYGLEANQAHPQHIHGFENDSNSTCPDDSADEDGDGLISLEEGLPSYGPVMVSLTMDGGDFPSANGEGIIIYQQTMTLGEGELPTSSMLDPLENRAVVLHGMTVDGEYWATLPVACGTVSSVE